MREIGAKGQADRGREGGVDDEADEVVDEPREQVVGQGRRPVDLYEPGAGRGAQTGFLGA